MDVTADELDRVTRKSLSTLPDPLADKVARLLVMAGRELDENPERALVWARSAARRASRVGVVREAVGVAAYRAGEFGLALTELRAAARILGTNEFLPMMADCERGLGRPEKALALAGSPEAAGLSRDGKVEMLIVAAGARRDQGQDEAAVLTLQVPALQSKGPASWLARLRYAYADALLAVGRADEARHWFDLAAQADSDAETDAAERLAELDGIVFIDVLDESVDEAEDGDGIAGSDSEFENSSDERQLDDGSMSSEELEH